MVAPLEACALLGNAAIAGSAFLATAIAQDAFPPLLLTSGRLVLGSTLLFLVLATCGRRFGGLGELPRLRGEEVVQLACIGVANTVVPYTLFAAALGDGIGVGLASVLGASTPLFAAVFSALFDRTPLPPDEARRRRPRLVAALLLGLLGVVVVSSLREAMSGGTASSARAVGLQLCGVASKALAAVGAQRYNRQCRQLHWQRLQRGGEAAPSPICQAFVQASAGALSAVLLALTVDCAGRTPPELDPRGLETGVGCQTVLARAAAPNWAALFALGLFGSCLVYLLQFFLFQRVGAVRQAIADQLALVIGVVEGALFRHDWDNATPLELLIFAAGAGLIAAGAALLYQEESEPRSSSAVLQPCPDALPGLLADKAFAEAKASQQSLPLLLHRWLAS